MDDEIVKWVLASMIVEYAITILIVCHLAGMPLHRVPAVAWRAFRAIIHRLFKTN